MRRAGQRCEYCQVHELDDPLLVFHIEHIVARQHHGSDALSNLAFACHHDNLHKGPNLTGLDPRSNKISRLFNPRVHKWSHHFRWNGAVLVGKTAIGRTTVYVLGMNIPYRVAMREALISAGRFPPR